MMKWKKLRKAMRVHYFVLKEVRILTEISYNTRTIPLCQVLLGVSVISIACCAIFSFLILPLTYMSACYAHVQGVIIVSSRSPAWTPGVASSDIFVN